MNQSDAPVLAIDPGRSKCGVAVVVRRPDVSASEPEFIVLYQDVIETAQLVQRINDLASEHHPRVVLIGGGTNSSNVVRLISSLNIAPVEIIDEEYTTLQARKRFFAQNPPKGLKRLIPLSLQTPSRPYDDFVAVILAEKYLQSSL